MSNAQGTDMLRCFETKSGYTRLKKQKFRYLGMKFRGPGIPTSHLDGQHEESYRGTLGLGSGILTLSSGSSTRGLVWRT